MAFRPRRRSQSLSPIRGREPASPRVGLDNDARRTMLADYLRLHAWWLGRPPMPELSPRLEQTLRALLAGDSEKQVAARLGVSVHTAHAHVKDVYRRLAVTSRGELMTKFLPRLPAAGAAISTPT